MRKVRAAVLLDGDLSCSVVFREIKARCVRRPLPPQWTAVGAGSKKLVVEEKVLLKAAKKKKKKSKQAVRTIYLFFSRALRPYPCSHVQEESSGGPTR